MGHYCQIDIGWIGFHIVIKIKHIFLKRTVERYFHEFEQAGFIEAAVY